MMDALWDKLTARAEAAASRRISALFDSNPRRAAEFSTDLGDLHFDFSKTNLDSTTLELLLTLAARAGITTRRAEMFSGVHINRTEDRAVMHWALRAPADAPAAVEGVNVHATLRRMEAFAEALRSGTFQGQGGPISDVVNIGIGGSDLGPAMAVRALSPDHDGPRCHFVANVDSADIADTLASLDPATTLVIVASKTFTTLETLTNACAAQDWMAQSVAEPGAQFAALSSHPERAAKLGIAAERVFGFENWVGGRYSLWGPIGLSLMLAVGPERFRDFLAGGHAMDRHFQEAPLAANMPVLLALTGIWHRQVCGYPTRAVLPYSQRLGRLPAYLQQLEMESNGKSVAMDGTALTRPAGPVVWGEPGTNCQHSFFQLIHQGTDVVPCEFLVAARGHEPDLADQHALLLANCLAQSRALMTGRTLAKARALMAASGLEGAALERAARHRVFAGNRPSTTLIFPQLTPFTLGRIVALYEHRVFVEWVVLGINSFDQWGVELGKELALALAPVVRGDASADDLDGSTRQLISYLRKTESGDA